MTIRANRANNISDDELMEFSEKFICKYEGFDTILNMSIKLCHEILIILLCNLALEWMSSEFHFWCTF